MNPRELKVRWTFHPDYLIDLSSANSWDDVLIPPEPAPRSTWHIRWCAIDGSERGWLDQRTVDPQADHEFDSANDLATWLNANDRDKYYYPSNGDPPSIIEVP